MVNCSARQRVHPYDTEALDGLHIIHCSFAQGDSDAEQSAHRTLQSSCSASSNSLDRQLAGTRALIFAAEAARLFEIQVNGLAMLTERRPAQVFREDVGDVF